MRTILMRKAVGCCHLVGLCVNLRREFGKSAFRVLLWGRKEAGIVRNFNRSLDFRVSIFSMNTKISGHHLDFLTLEHIV